MVIGFWVAVAVAVAIVCCVTGGVGGAGALATALFSGQPRGG